MSNFDQILIMRLGGFYSFIFILLLICCDQSKSRDQHLLSYLPEETSVVIKINNLDNLKSELKNNGFLKDAAQTTSYKTIKKVVRAMDPIQSDTTGILAFVEGDSTQILFITYEQPNWLETDSIHQDTLSPKGIVSKEINGISIYTTTHEGKRLVSNSNELVTEAINRLKTTKGDDLLRELYQTASARKTASVFVNTKIQSEVLPPFLNPSKAVPQFFPSEWITFDLDFGQHYVNLNGLIQVKDTTHNFLRLFESTNPVENISPQIAPANTDAILSYTFDDFDTFSQNQSTYLNSPYSISTELNTAEELGIIYLNNEKAVVLNTYSAEGVQSFLDGIERSSKEYQGYEIKGLRSNGFLTETFQPLLSKFAANYYTIIDDKFVFSENSKLLENIISNRNSGSRFTDTSIYQGAQKALTDESNILLLANAEGLKLAGSGILSEQLIEQLLISNPKEQVYSSQIVADERFYHTHFSINRLSSKGTAGATIPLFTIQLDGDVVTDPQFVVNHRTNMKEIVVQDSDNNLYLISSEGKVLWKKALEGRIQGKIHQVDIYKNGRLQLAFTTSDQFIILDRNGKEVAPFNKKYPGGNLNPLAVFDYEKNKNYRFVVTQGRKVFMYNPQGNIVTGFTYKESESAIIKAPKHIRIAQRDYLVFQLEDGTLKILNRVGRERIPVAEKIAFSDNEVYHYRNKFILTDKSGTLFSIDPDGKVSKSRLNLKEDHGIDATLKTLTTVNENTLTIKGKSRDMELGVYLRPKIFYIYDKIYVSSTDIQSGQVYLFDSSNKPISNFPVFGNSTADLADLENDGKLELVTKDSDNSLIVYSLR